MFFVSYNGVEPLSPMYVLPQKQVDLYRTPDRFKVIAELWLRDDFELTLSHAHNSEQLYQCLNFAENVFFFIYAARGADASLEKGSLKTDVFLVQLSNPWTKAFPKQLYPLLKCY